MFNVCIKHMNKVMIVTKLMRLKKIISLSHLRLNICLMYELNIYLCCKMLQS